MSEAEMEEAVEATIEAAAAGTATIEAVAVMAKMEVATEMAVAAVTAKTAVMTGNAGS
jgi:hypothetical protein